MSKTILEASRVMSRASTDAVDLIEDLIEQQFDAGVDTDGDAWAPLAESTKRRGRQDPPLDDTGALRVPAVEALQSAGIRISYEEDYAGYHQSGTSRMPARKLVPDQDRLPQAWQMAIVEAYNNAFYGNAGWRAAGAEVSEDTAHAAEE